MLGDISPSERLIAADAIARTPEARFQNVNDRGRRACAIPVAQHNIEATDIGGVRGHRVAIQQHRKPEPAARALNQGLQLRVIGPVERLDPPETVGDRKSASGRLAARRQPPWELCPARPQLLKNGCLRSPAGGHRKSVGRVRTALGSHRGMHGGTRPVTMARRARHKAKTARRRKRPPSGAGSADRAARRQESAEDRLIRNGAN